LISRPYGCHSKRTRNVPLIRPATARFALTFPRTPPCLAVGANGHHASAESCHAVPDARCQRVHSFPAAGTPALGCNRCGRPTSESACNRPSFPTGMPSRLAGFLTDGAVLDMDNPSRCPTGALGNLDRASLILTIPAAPVMTEAVPSQMKSGLTVLRTTLPTSRRLCGHMNEIELRSADGKAHHAQARRLSRSRAATAANH